MQSRQYPLVFLATTLLLTLTERAGVAFTISPPSLFYQNSSSYTLPDGRSGTSYLDPLTLTSLPRGGTDGLLAALNATFSGWTFNQADADLNGSFDPSLYYTTAGSDQVLTRLQFTYTPDSNDPTPSSNNLHWIERVVSNHLSDDLPNGGHGVAEDRIDIYASGQQNNPYYDTFFDADRGNYFQQSSIRNDPQNNHNWFGEVYLVEETAPQTVKIYNGLRWGWGNKLTRPGYYTDIIAGGIGASLSGYTPNDDGSFGAYPLGFSLNYFGQTDNDFYINNNGNISFGNGVIAYTPDSLNTETSAPMIAPYWADVDTRGTGTVSLRTDIPNQAIVTWDNVGYFDQHTDKTASFQLVLRGPDYPIPNGEGNIGFFYKDVQWETGDASGGNGGFGGTPADVGFGDGLSTVNSGEFSLPGSLQAGIGQLVSNNYYWFNLSCDSSSGGGCSVSRVDSIGSGNSSAISYRTTDRELPISDIESDTSQLSKSAPDSKSLFASAISSWFNSFDFQSKNTRGCSAK